MPLLNPSASRNSVPQPLPSLPPSPTEDDLGGSVIWREDSEEGVNILGNGHGDSSKGKERAREISLDDDADVSEGDVTPTLDSGYPPLKEEEEESRKVQENLKRLEAEERQRRRAARESSASVAPSSVVADVSRRATLLFSSRRSNSGGSSRGNLNLGGSRGTLNHVHSQLGQSSEDALPLSDLHHDSSSNTLVSPSASEPSSPAHVGRSSAMTGSGPGPLNVPTIIENPFEPPDSATPLRGFDAQQGVGDEDDELSGSAVMRPSSPPSSMLIPEPSKAAAAATSPFDDETVLATGRPTIQASSSFSRPHPAPPPLPLDLPPPKTPPPRAETPGGTRIVVTSPPTRTSAPLTSRPGRANANEGSTTLGQRQNQDETEDDHRWWTDWLCGCREEKDKDNAGRTNPFE